MSELEELERELSAPSRPHVTPKAEPVHIPEAPKHHEIPPPVTHAPRKTSVPQRGIFIPRDFLIFLVDLNDLDDASSHSSHPSSHTSSSSIPPRSEYPLCIFL